MKNNKYTREDKIRFFTKLLEDGKCEEYIQDKLRKLDNQQDWSERVSKEIVMLQNRAEFQQQSITKIFDVLAQINQKLSKPA